MRFAKKQISTEINFSTDFHKNSFLLWLDGERANISQNAQKEISKYFPKTNIRKEILTESSKQAQDCTLKKFFMSTLGIRTYIRKF